MRDPLILSLPGLCLALSGMAQSPTPSVIATAGGQHRTTTLVLEWTLGETVVETVRFPNRVYTQGFHQPVLQVAEQVDPANPSLTDADYLIEVFPNPVQAILTVRIRMPTDSPMGKNGETVRLNLTDLMGKPLRTKVASSADASVELNMADLPGGVYLLSIQSATGVPVKAYKVLKN